MAMIDEPHGAAADAPPGEYDVGVAFGAHDIEWWVYDGTRLVPAPPEHAALFSHLHDHPPLPVFRRRGRWLRIMDHLARPGA
jgi:hypothetical protein